ncbi:MAG: peptidoglycan recognition protein family protein [Brevinematales bacterium]|nr:peptidoglycan recognition protein family protein [Brevinematales bacterium]
MLRSIFLVLGCLCVIPPLWNLSYSNLLGQVSERRLTLTKEYMRDHYGIDSYLLTNPKMIVIHYTVTPDLPTTLSIFLPDELPAMSRPELAPYGRVNIGVHFLVDRDGTIYSFLPLWMVGRHTIGFNHVAIGIENIAKNAKTLTTAQLESNAYLIKTLVETFPSIQYLIGHHEYLFTNLPHFSLYKENYPHYRTEKFDPGPVFMKKLREKLQKTYNIYLLE